jgi:hypothetical protein
MSDLVKRLRAEDPECGLRHSIAMEAADYIEALETAISEWGYAIVDWEGIDFVDRIENKNARYLIEEVLEKKDDKNS